MTPAVGDPSPGGPAGLQIRAVLHPRGPVAALVLDGQPREVEVPDDLSAALDATPAARTAFDALAYSHRKEFVRWVTEAKKPETRERRIDEIQARLAEGRTR